MTATVSYNNIFNYVSITAQRSFIQPAEHIHHHTESRKEQIILCDYSVFNNSELHLPVYHLVNINAAYYNNLQQTSIIC